MYAPKSLLATLAAALAVVGAAPAAAAPADGPYVALGDSYTSGPLIPNPKGEPKDCGRSDHNYPTLVAEQIAPAEFVDVSCGSAKTTHMTEPQTELPLGGTNPPQFDALGRRVELVTLGIGGNDMGFGEIVETCAELGIQSGGQGQPCTDHYNAGGFDEVARRLKEVVAPRLAKVIDGVQERSPRARFLLVGYPDPVPQHPGCYPEVPIAPGDLPYLHEVAQGLSATVKRKARRGGAEYVDLLTGSIGHDICQPPGTKWYEGIAPTSPAYPAHPNALGMEFAAGEVLGTLSHAVPNRFRILRRHARPDGRIALRLKAPARGLFWIRATSRSDSGAVAKRDALVRYGRAQRLATRARKLTVRVRPRRAATRLLEREGRLRVSMKVAFRPVGGKTHRKQTSVRVGR